MSDQAWRYAGFNLIELMIVIAIMAILAAIAVPAYSRYINKSRVISAVILTNPFRTAITEYAMMHHGGLNSVSNASLHMDSKALVADSKDVESINVKGIDANTVELSAELADGLGTLSWKGSYKPETGHMSWNCFYPSGSHLGQYAPHGCVAA